MDPLGLAGSGLAFRAAVLAASVAVGVAAIELASCGGGSSGGNAGGGPSGGGAAQAFTGNDAATVTSNVSAANGGTLTASTGDKLVIPAGALRSDVSVTMTPLQPPTDSTRLVRGGVAFQPDSLAFTRPATLTVRLATPMDPGLELLLADGPGTGVPAQFGESGGLFSVDPSGTTATGLIYGFSGKAVMKNCHSGTRDNLIAAWSAGNVQGHDVATLSQKSGVSQQDLTTCDQLGADPLQQFLRPFFTKCNEFRPGETFTQQEMNLIQQRLQAGKQVVFLFGQNITLDSTGQTYQNVSHSAVATLQNGQVVVKNQLNVDPASHPGVDTTFVQPLSAIDQPDGLRQMVVGQAYANALGLQGFDPTNRPVAWPHVIVMCEAQCFQCRGGPCIDASKVCNGTNDCAGGEDEDPSVCSNTHGCCVATSGCPGETGTACGQACCCCPFGQRCCPDQSGCCNSP